MVSLYFNKCSLPILRAANNSVASITPQKGKDLWEIRDDVTGETIASYNPRQPAKRTTH